MEHERNIGWSKAEVALAELASHTLVLDQHAIVAVTDTRGTITYVNDKFCHTSGYSRKELIGQNHRLLNSGHHPDSFFAGMYMTLENGGVWHGEIRNRAKDGSHYWLESTVAPFRDASGKIVQYIAIRTDITGLHLRDKAIRDQNDRFNAALENMSQGLSMFDGEQRLIIANERYASMYDLSLEQIKAGNLLRQVLEYRIANGHYAGASPEDYIKERMEWVTGGISSSKVQKLCDGRSIEISLTPMTGGGWLTTHEDVTERKRAEDELTAHRDHLQELVETATRELKNKADELTLALAKEQELNKLQRQFISMASHEFRTPLAIIDATAQRMKSRADKNRLTPEDAVRRVEKIRAAVGRMTRLMDSTLTAARLEEGKIAIEIAPCDVATAVMEVCARQQEISQTHVISCDLANLPDTIQADEAALERILTNLLSNAVKYAPGAPDIEVTARSEGDQVVISVRDHGLGIDADELHRIGERFFRARTSTGTAGTGIGLHMVKTLAKMHGGRVSVESKKGEGSTFTVRLPIAGPDQTEQADTRAA